MRYTIRGQLARIGDPASTSYPFSARYAYHPNGTVSESEFYSAGSPVSPRYRYTFGTSSYDALNRLRSADYSYWSGSAWTSTQNRDLAGTSYDASGNLLSLQRYGNQGTLVDNLSYSYASTSNRLGSVSDAVSTTTEDWDAEDGSFTYDANGNLKSAPAPYSITSVTYDHGNLPLSLTSGGLTTTYRYDHQGQRITKRVGTGATEVYLLEGATPLAVFTVDAAGTPTAWHFNVLAGERVVGRAPHTGGRRYYHTDLLGSTRAVVEGTSVLESYDYDPWGLLLPGRTLAGDTKEGFTGKERDAESGLDYFGARLYMPALGRWTTVDPPADSFPEWNPYNYVENNPAARTDPDGRCPCLGAARYFIPLKRFGSWLSGWDDAFRMTAQWATGTGPETRTFGEGTRQVGDLRQAPGVQAAREMFYSKNAEALESGGDLEPLTNFGASFGLRGLVRAGINPTQQFVGSYDINIAPNDDETITFTLTNVTSATSAFYRLLPPWDRSTIGLGGNMIQVYTWDERLERK